MSNTNIYALNDNNELIRINDSLNNTKYFCPNCNKEMGIRKGNIREHHFYHLTKECSYETYIHSIGKKILYDKINYAIQYNLNLIIDNINEYKQIILDEFDEEIEDNDYFNLSFINIFNYYKEKEKNIDYFYNKFIKLENNEILFNYFKEYFNNMKKDIDVLFTNNNSIYGIKGNYSTNILNKIPGDYQIYELSKNEKSNLKIKWDNVKNKNLYEILLFIVENINFAYIEDHLDIQIYENIKFKKIKEDNIIKELINSFFPIITHVDYIFDKIIKIDIPLNNNCKVFLDSKKVGKYLPDVLLEMQNNKFISFEIVNTHKSSKEKINSNLNIIEIDIKNNIDLENLYYDKFNLLSIRKY